MELTPAEKGKITRAKNKAARDAADAIRRAEEKEDRERAKAAMRSILTDDRATPQQRLDALEILDGLTCSHMVPLAISKRGEERAEKDLISEFKAELEKFQSRNSPAE